jgi:hypothetical protein
VAIQVSATGYAPGTGTIAVTDHESITLAISSPSLSENRGAVNGTVSRGNSDINQPLVVNLANSDSGELAVPLSVTIPPHLPSISFVITAVDDSVLDGTQTVTITASAAGYVSQSKNVDVKDHETLALVIDPQSISEDSGIATGTISRGNTDVAQPLTVTLSISDPVEATVPVAVTIAAGQNSATFSIEAMDDQRLDTASASGYVPASDTLEIADHGIPWQNSANRFDVTGDGQVAPLDALVVINDLNLRNSRNLMLLLDGRKPPPFLPKGKSRR